MSPIKTTVICVGVLACGFGAVALLNHFKTAPEQQEAEIILPTVESIVVRKSDRRIDVDTQGTVRPRTEIDLTTQVAGEVRRISPSLADGGFFAAKEVLVQLDDRDYVLEVTRAKAAVAQSTLRVSMEEAEAEIAREEWEALGNGKATPLTLREPQRLEAKAALAATTAALAKAELALSRTTIRAPFAGRVRVKSIDVGQFASVGTRLARVYAVDFAEVRLPIHDSKLRYVEMPLSFRDQTGAASMPKVTLSTRFAQRTHSWEGTIVRTEGEVDAKSRMIHAIARVKAPYDPPAATERPPLSVGMFVQARIHGRTFRDVFEVPRRALREGKAILVIDGEQCLRTREVSILIRGDKTVVIDKGLNDGERVCLSSIAVFFEGMKVLLRDTENDASSGNGR